MGNLIEKELKSFDSPEKVPLHLYLNDQSVIPKHFHLYHVILLIQMLIA